MSYYIISDILSHRGAGDNKEYLVSWKGYDEPTWEPALIMLQDVPELVERYEIERPVYQSYSDYIRDYDEYKYDDLLEQGIRRSRERQGQTQYLVDYVDDPASIWMDEQEISVDAPNVLNEFTGRLFHCDRQHDTPAHRTKPRDLLSLGQGLCRTCGKRMRTRRGLRIHQSRMH